MVNVWKGLRKKFYTAVRKSSIFAITCGCDTVQHLAVDVQNDFCIVVYNERYFWTIIFPLGTVFSHCLRLYSTQKSLLEEWITCGNASGRDSNITINTPMGTDSWTSSKSSAIFVLRKTRPMFSWELSAICLMPAARLVILLGVRESLDNKGGVRFCDNVAASRSLAFASRISVVRSSRRSASRKSISAR